MTLPFLTRVDLLFRTKISLFYQWEIWGNVLGTRIAYFDTSLYYFILDMPQVKHILETLSLQ